MGEGRAPQPKGNTPSKGYLEYQPELDGMRGLGLLTVVYHHGMHFWSGPRYTGGFYALDTFFVLSGYLITTLLIREWDRFGSISLKNFYIRRALRLVPALLVTIVLGFVTVQAISGTFARPYYQSSFAALSYVANWFQIQRSIDPLAHTWTLSVEEQYYLVWSAMMFFGLRAGASKRRMAAVAMLGAVGIWVARPIFFHLVGPNFVVLSTFTRPDGVLIGSALALLMVDIPRRLKELLARRDVGLLLAGLVVAGTFVLEWRLRPYHYGGLALFNLLTAALIAHMVVAPSSGPRWVLSWKPLAGLGRISYGVYLYHVPILWMVVNRPPSRLGVGWVGLYFVLSVVAGVVSWFVLERPVLRLKSRFGSMSKMPEHAAGPDEPASGLAGRPAGPDEHEAKPEGQLG